jgi:flagellar biosynthesis GTPase FlhF
MIKEYLKLEDFGDEAEIRRQMDKIINRIQKDKLDYIQTKQKYQEVLNNIGNAKEFKSSLRSLLRSIEPFNIDLFRELLEKYKEESKKIKGQQVYLLIGQTGAGKSTTCHYLAGS